MKEFVAYYRVSTTRQGKSGLGLEAQKQCVEQLVNARHGALLKSFTEVESGKVNERPQLEAAIQKVKEAGAVLVIAKLDRLSRNASFIFNLRDSGVEFIACDMPEANTLTIGIMAVMAQQEREMISKRTREALAAKKAQGVKLGNPQNLTAEARRKGNEVRKRKARNNQQWKQASLALEGMNAKGMSLQAMADALNEAGYTTRTGKQFKSMTVKRLIDKIKKK